MCTAIAPAPQHAAVSLEVSFASQPIRAQPWVLQARVAIRPIAGTAAEAGHTGWFVLSPEVARRMAADLLEAAEAAERGSRPT